MIRKANDNLSGYVRRLSVEDVDELTFLHLNSIVGSSNAELGEEHIGLLYKTVLSSDDGFGYGYFYNEQLVAFEIGSHDALETRKRISKIYSPIKRLHMIVSNIYSLNRLFGLIESAFLIPRKIKRTDIQAELLTWLSLRDHPIAGVAAIRVDRMCRKHLFDSGHHYALAQTVKDNPYSNKYHKRNGDRIIASYWHNYLWKIGMMRNKIS